MADSLDRLYQAVLAAYGADPSVSRTARLLHAGRAKMAKKLAEEAIEVVIDAMQANREAVVRRERLFGIAEKLKAQAPPKARRKVAASAIRQPRKHR
jgi:phosphoribosyl-ATP pyrophosphohydrolase